MCCLIDLEMIDSVFII